MKTLFHKFTTCSATNNVGPNQNAINNCYPGSKIRISSIQGIQKFIVPVTDYYVIEANGAAGYSTYFSSGRGAKVRGTFKLKKGSIIYVLVGQQGYAPGSNWGGPGGGASYVAIKTNIKKYYFPLDNSYVTPLIVAGGGGGSGDDNHPGEPKYGEDATCNNLGDGGGYNNEDTSTGGAGFSFNSVNGKAKSFLNGGTTCTYTGVTGTSFGGFGGGGCSDNSGGGGGGFKGGNSDIPGARGTGGSSYNSGLYQTCIGGSNRGVGYVTFYRTNTQFTVASNKCFQVFLLMIIIWIILSH